MEPSHQRNPSSRVQLRPIRVPFVCECDDPSCAHAIVMRLDEYEQAVKPPDQFVVRPGHQDPAVERIVECQDGYIVVSKPDLQRR